MKCAATLIDFFFKKKVGQTLAHIKDDIRYLYHQTTTTGDGVSEGENMDQIIFQEINGRVHFACPNNPDLEASIRASIKKHTCKAGKAEFFFRRGIFDAAKSVQSGCPRQYGTPMIKVKDLQTGFSEVMTCQKAFALRTHRGVGGLAFEQVSGSPLPKDCFTLYHVYEEGHILFSGPKRQVRSFLLDGAAWANPDGTLHSSVIIISDDDSRVPLTDFITDYDFIPSEKWDKIVQKTE